MILVLLALITTSAVLDLVIRNRRPRSLEDRSRGTYSDPRAACPGVRVDETPTGAGNPPFRSGSRRGTEPVGGYQTHP